MVIVNECVCFHNSWSLSAQVIVDSSLSAVCLVLYKKEKVRGKKIQCDVSAVERIIEIQFLQ